jgi:hypothetical protein
LVLVLFRVAFGFKVGTKSFKFYRFEKGKFAFPGQFQKKKDVFKMTAHKTLRIKVKLAKKTKQNWLIPQWICRRTGNMI